METGKSETAYYYKNKNKIMNKVDDEVIINDICDYAKKHKVKELLQEYLRRIIVDQPEDPVNGHFRNK